MTHKEFINQYGHALITTDYDNGEYGDNIILYPEEQEKALEWYDTHQLVSLHETEDYDTWVDIQQPCDMGYQPFKYAYYVIDKRELTLPTL